MRRRNTDGFARAHPLVVFSFFALAVLMGTLIAHPAYLLVGCGGALTYYILLKGRESRKPITVLLLLFVVITGINPLFNMKGERVLFCIFDRPYTVEALLYGASIAAIFVIVLLWFYTYSIVMTEDRFISLFGHRFPALSLLLVLIMGTIPGILRKASEITGARGAIGKGAKGSLKKKIRFGMEALSALTSWTLEGGIVKADSMRSRGYGEGRRSSFSERKIDVQDIGMLILMALLVLGVLIGAVSGGVSASYTPRLLVASIGGWNALGFTAYCIYVFIPAMLYWKEAFVWHISRSGI